MGCGSGKSSPRCSCRENPSTSWHATRNLIAFTSCTSCQCRPPRHWSMITSQRLSVTMTIQTSSQPAKGSTRSRSKQLFSRFAEFLDDSHHPKWREVNLAARLPGWQRFGPAERWLQRPSAGEAATSPAGEAAISGAMDEFLRRNPNLPHREELLRDFQWLLKSKQGR